MEPHRQTFNKILTAILLPNAFDSGFIVKYNTLKSFILSQESQVFINRFPTVMVGFAFNFGRCACDSVHGSHRRKIFIRIRREIIAWDREWTTCGQQSLSGKTF